MRTKSPAGDTLTEVKSWPFGVMACHQQHLYHLVFSTKERRPLLHDDAFRKTIWRYVAGVCSNWKDMPFGLAATTTTLM
ncbi:MAG: hypothetical protein AAF802_05750 [Planctomycetota bacterium]